MVRPVISDVEGFEISAAEKALFQEIRPFGFILFKRNCDNQDQLKIEYVDFNYAIINPKNLIGADEFNQSFFDKIDQIEIDISNDVSFENIISDLDIKSINVKNFKFSQKKNFSPDTFLTFYTVSCQNLNSYKLLLNLQAED